MTARWRTALAVGRLVPGFLLLGVLKHVVPLPALVRWVWAGPRASAARDVHRVASVVLKTASIVGVPDRDCLQRSLLLYRELSRSGHGPELAVGFRRESGRMLGHAWVLVNGAVVAEASGVEPMFETLIVFGARGAMVIGAPQPAASAR